MKTVFVRIVFVSMFLIGQNISAQDADFELFGSEPAGEMATRMSDQADTSDSLVTENQVHEIIQSYLNAQKVEKSSEKDSAPTPPPAKKAEEKSPTYPAMKMTGFFQLDAARFSQDAASRATLGDIQDGLGFRRARLAATGSLSKSTTYMFEFDIAQSQARFVDVWGQFADTPVGNVRIGRFRQPFGMTELTSVRELPFIERPSPFAISPFRQTGIMVFDTAMNEQITWAASGFRALSDNFGNVYGDDGGFGTALRLTCLPIDCGDTGLVHLGVDHSYVDPARNQLQYATQDEIFVGQNPNFGPNGLSVLPLDFVPPFVQSGVFSVNHVNLFNLEAAASVGRALLQSEMRWSQVSLPDGANSTVPAFYLHGRYMLTNDIIPYNRKAGVFGRVSPKAPVKRGSGQWGAWELATQVSHIDLNNLASQPLVPGPGRRMTNVSAGMIWYLQANSKMHFEYIHSILNDRVVGDSNVDVLAAMVQFDF